MRAMFNCYKLVLKLWYNSTLTKVFPKSRSAYWSPPSSEAPGPFSSKNSVRTIFTQHCRVSPWVLPGRHLCPKAWHLPLGHVYLPFPSSSVAGLLWCYTFAIIIQGCGGAGDPACSTSGPAVMPLGPLARQPAQLHLGLSPWSQLGTAIASAWVDPLTHQQLELQFYPPF